MSEIGIEAENREEAMRKFNEMAREKGWGELKYVTLRGLWLINLSEELKERRK